MRNQGSILLAIIYTMLSIFATAGVVLMVLFGAVEGNVIPVFIILSIICALVLILALIQYINLALSHKVKIYGKPSTCKFMRFSKIHARGYSIYYMHVYYVDEFGKTRNHKVPVPFSYLNRRDLGDIPCKIKGSRCYIDIRSF